MINDFENCIVEMSWCRALVILLLLVCVIAIVVVLVDRPRFVIPISKQLPHEDNNSVEAYKSKMSNYLNVNSTLATETGQLNASDLGYQEMIEQRRQKLIVFNKIRRFIDAPINSKVILTSGATEGIATCVNWAKCYNPYGAVVGTSFDHEAVEANAVARGMDYVKITKPEEMPGNIACFFLTHVCSKTGEILQKRMIELPGSVVSIQRMKSDFDIESSKSNATTTSYPPLAFVDATQSIGKIPVSMREMNANALLFSLHKLGGPQGLGILVVSEPEFNKFIPLIAGKQNDGMRGGTQNEQALVESSHIFKLSSFSPSSRKQRWNEVRSRLLAADVKLIEPKCDHLYNTFLIELPLSCPIGFINSLARRGVYIGTASACSNESQSNKNKSVLVRLSFIDPSEFTDEALEIFIDEVKKVNDSQ